MVEKHFKIITITRFARQATALVKVACQFNSNIFIEYKDKSLELKDSPQSILDVISLGIRPHTPFHIRIEGMDEYEALQSLENHLSKI